MHSVIEWISGICLILTYREVTKDHYWRWLSLGMLPTLLIVMCAFAGYFFENIPFLN